MCIHRFLFVLVDLTEPLIRRQRPIAFKRFKVAIVLTIATMAFQQIEELERQVRSPALRD